MQLILKQIDLTILNEFQFSYYYENLNSTNLNLLSLTFI